MKIARWVSSVPLRVRTLFSKQQVERELDEEMQFHLEKKIEELVGLGMAPLDAKRAARKVLGVERQMQQCRDVRAWQGWERLRADVVFGWRQLMKRKVTTAAAVLSLGLAMGSCVAAFRLIDALLLRPLPIAHPERLVVLSRVGTDSSGAPRSYDTFAYPDFQLMRAAAGKDADLIAVSPADRYDLTYKTDEEMEKAYVQYVSGRMFSSFGLQPALGRLLTREDDVTPGAAPYAVISYDYWSRRFGRDPKVVGQTFRMGTQMFEVVGVGPKDFTGTEPGTVVDIFLPTMMYPDVTRDDASWHRTLAIVAPGVELEPLRAKLDAVSHGFEVQRSKSWTGMSAEQIARSLNDRMLMTRAASGVSELQGDYRNALVWLGVLVALVLLIACTNVANLMTAVAAARMREMAVRVSLGAGRGRLVRLVMAESVMLAILASVVGGVLAWWSAPMVVRMINPADNPARLMLDADWRVMGFAVLLLLAATMLFGLVPALRAARLQPVSALKGGEEQQGRGHGMYALIATQVAFCFVVLFLAGLFVQTFHRLENKPVGFDAKGLLLLETESGHGQTPEAWGQLAETLRGMPGVKQVAISGRPLMTGSWNGPISINNGPPSDDWSYFLNVAPGWLGTMKLPLVEGRDFVASDSFPGEAIVNQEFVRRFFHGADPIGKTFEKTGGEDQKLIVRVVGVVADAPYRYLREAPLGVAFVPTRRVNAKGEVMKDSGETLLVQTAEADPMSMAAEMRRKVAAAGAGFRVSNVETQQELIDNQTVRERLLAMLGGFFAGVALLLAAIGLYGVLHYSVVQRERELGIRIALGAAAGNIARVVTVRVMLMVLLGAAVGLGAGLASVRFVQTLLYGVRGTDVSMMVVPAVVLLLAAGLAALPAVMRAVRIDPVVMLRSE